MNFSDYQCRAVETAVYPKAIGLQYVTLGLTGEAGEIANSVKKIFRDDKGALTAARRESLKKELGDVLWYAAMVAYELAIDLDEVAESNIQKLQARSSAGTIHGSGDER